MINYLLSIFIINFPIRHLVLYNIRPFITNSINNYMTGWFDCITSSQRRKNFLISLVNLSTASKNSQLMTNCITIVLLNWNNMHLSFAFSITKLAKRFASNSFLAQLLNFLINLEPFFIIKSFSVQILLVFLNT